MTALSYNFPIQGVFIIALTDHVYAEGDITDLIPLICLYRKYCSSCSFCSFSIQINGLRDYRSLQERQDRRLGPVLSINDAKTYR